MEEPSAVGEDAFPTGPPEVLVFTSRVNGTNESFPDNQGGNARGDKFYLPVGLTVCVTKDSFCLGRLLFQLCEALHKRQFATFLWCFYFLETWSWRRPRIAVSPHWILRFRVHPVPSMMENSRTQQSHLCIFYQWMFEQNQAKAWESARFISVSDRIFWEEFKESLLSLAVEFIPATLETFEKQHRLYNVPQITQV